MQFTSLALVLLLAWQGPISRRGIIPASFGGGGGGGGATLVQQHSTNVASNTTMSVTFSATTAGNFLVVGFFNTNAIATGCTATGATTDTLTSAVSFSANTQILYAFNIHGGNTTVTCTYPFGTAAMVAAEFSGVQSGSDPKDTAPAGAQGAFSGSINANEAWASNSTGTLAQANELVIGLCADQQGATATYTPGAGFATVGAGGGIGGLYMEYENVTATTALTGNGTRNVAANHEFNALVATFKTP